MTWTCRPRDWAARRIGRARPIVAALALVLAASGPSFADEGVFSYYVGVRAVGTWSMIDNTETSGFTGTPLIENDTDAVAGAGVVFGYVSPNLPLRVELEVAHRFRFDYDVRDVTASGIVDNETNVSTNSALVSGIAEWRNVSSFTPFAGVSLGWARNSSHVDRTDLRDGSLTSRETDKDNFAWGGLVGVDWDFAESWAAEAAYRYTDLGAVDAGAAATGDSIKGGDYTSHDLLLSILYRF